MRFDSVGISFRRDAVGDRCGTQQDRGSTLYRFLTRRDSDERRWPAVFRSADADLAKRPQRISLGAFSIWHDRHQRVRRVDAVVSDSLSKSLSDSALP